MNGAGLRAAILSELDRRPDRAWDLAAEQLLAPVSLELETGARLFLPHIAPRLPASAWNAARSALARHLGLAAGGETGQVGVVAFPVVADGGAYFAHACVELAGEDHLPELPAAAAAAVRAALAAARACLGSAAPLRVLVEPVDGASLGLAVGLAAASRLRNRPVPDRIAATGVLAADGQVGSVGHIAEKLHLLGAARPRAVLLAPCGAGRGHPAVREVAGLAAALAELDIRPAGDPLDLLGQVRAAFAGGDWADGARLGEHLRLSPDLEPAERLELLALLLTAANHSADARRAADLVAELAGVVDAAGPGVGLARAIAGAAVHHIDHLRLDLAAGVLAAAAPERFAPAARLHLDGTAALLLVARGRFEEALHLREENLGRAGDELIDERPRCLGDLADACWRVAASSGATTLLGRARDLADEALVETGRRRGVGYRNQTRPYVALHGARVCRRQGDLAAARRFLDLAGAAAGTEIAFRLELERAVLEGDAARARAAFAALPPWMREVPVIEALVRRAEAEARNDLRSGLEVPY